MPFLVYYPFGLAPNQNDGSVTEFTVVIARRVTLKRVEGHIFFSTFSLLWLGFPDIFGANVVFRSSVVGVVGQFLTSV